MNENRYTLVIEGECPSFSSSMKIYIESAGERQFGGRVMEFYYSDALMKIEQLEEEARKLCEVIGAAKEFCETLHINKNEPPVPVAGKLKTLMESVGALEDK